MLSELENALQWGPARRMPTRQGPMLIRRAEANDIARGIWSGNRLELARHGYSFARDRDGALCFYHWAPDNTSLTKMRRSLILSRATDSTFEPPVPGGLAYYGFQKAGIAFAWEHRNALIADEMGLGKTLQAIGVANLAHEREEVKWLLVVTLASLKINWQREIERWATFPLEVSIAEGETAPARIEDLFASNGARALIINYSLLNAWIAPLKAVPWDIYIADEAHNIKNPKSARGAVGLSIEARRMLFLTGTPMENEPREIWPILHALQPLSFNSFFRFAQRYCDAKQKVIGYDRAAGSEIKKWDFSGSSNLDELNNLLRSHVMIRRLKKDVLADLPRKQRQVIELPAACADVDDELGLFMRAEEKLAALRMAVERAKCGEDIKSYRAAVSSLAKESEASFQEMAAKRCDIAMAKIPMTVMHLRELIDAGQKVICFAHHQKVVSRLTREFKKECVVVKGGMKTAERQESVDRFQNDSAVRLAVISIKAGGTGLNLTAATVVVFLELDWVPATMQQAEDRAHRIGQVKSVLIQLLVLAGSLDARIARRLIEKLDIADQSLDGRASDAPVVPWMISGAGEDADPQALQREGEKIPEAQVHAIHRALRHLAAQGDDGSSVMNAIDIPIAVELAGSPALSAKQAAMGLRFVRRYHDRLPEEITSQADPVTVVPIRPNLMDLGMEKSA